MRAEGGVAARSRLQALAGMLTGKLDAVWRWPQPELIELATRHRVEPLLYASLQTGTPRWQPEPATLRVLERCYQTNAQRVLRWLAWFEPVTGALANEGIPARPLKGLPLAEQAYRRPADRHCRDIDLLIASEANRERAGGVLAGLGIHPLKPVTPGFEPVMRRYEKADAYLTPDGTLIELHFHRGGAGSDIFPDFLAFDSPAWRPCVIGRSESHRLGGPCSIIYLLSHGTRAMWSRLKWLVDVHRLTAFFRPPDWRALVRRAAAERLDAQCLVGIELLRSSFGPTGLPRPVPRRVPTPVSLVAWRCREGLEDETAPSMTMDVGMGARDLLARWLVSKSWSARRALLIRFLYREKDFVGRRLPTPVMVLVGPLLRPLSLLYRRTLGAAFRRVPR